jgi:hypothetical protein
MMAAFFGVFEAIFDELGKEIKDAPGWLSLVIACNLLLFLPPVHAQLTAWDMIEHEVTLATFFAMCIFFLGDVVDTVIYPRERDGERGKKIFRSSMLLLGGVVVFLLFVKAWKLAAPLAFLWFTIIPIWASFNSRGTNKGGSEETSEPSSAAPPSGGDSVREECPEPNLEYTGYPGLVPKYGDLEKVRGCATSKLRVTRGIYPISLALTRKAGEYNWAIWGPNEAAKFVRSTIVPTFLTGMIGTLFYQKCWGLIVAALACPLVFLYTWLKALHMRLLYESTCKSAGTGRLGSPEPEYCVRLFFWDGQFVGSVSLKKKLSKAAQDGIEVHSDDKTR